MTIKKRKLSNDIFGYPRYKYNISGDDGRYEMRLLVEHFCNNCQIVTIGGIEDLTCMMYSPKNLKEAFAYIYDSILETFNVPRILLDVNYSEPFIPDGFSVIKTLKYTSSYDGINRQIILIEKD